MMACLRTLGGVIINTAERGGASDVNARVIGRVLEALEDESRLVRRLGDNVRVRVHLAAEVYITKNENPLYLSSWYGSTVNMFNVIFIGYSNTFVFKPTATRPFKYLFC